MNKRVLLAVTISTLSGLLVSFKLMTPTQEPWKAPAWADGLKPQGRQNPNAAAEGKALYAQYCVACHGANGKGDGALVAESPIKPADFHSASFKIQKDGPIFWKIAEGRGLMPSFKTTLTDAQRWSLVAYVRELSGGAGSVATKPANLLPVAGFEIPDLKSAYIPVPSRVLNAVKSEALVFMVDTVIKGLTRPWSMAFLPDNRMLITERSGKLRIVKDGQLQPNPVSGNVPTGLRDVKLHPQFEKNHLIYLSYYIEPKKPEGGYTVLMRAKLDGDRISEEKILYKAGPFQEGGETYGSRIAFDKAGYLYFTVGQRTIDSRHRWKTVQDKSNPSGKVMRFNDDGSIPVDNPFVDSVGVLKEIYTFGHRQPQGLIRHPVLGDIWESEHGEMGGSELNQLQKGGNYGWPDVTFSRNYDGTLISPDTAKAGTISPAHHWIPSIAPSDFDFVYGDRYAPWNGDLFIGAMVLRRLNRTSFRNGKPVHDEVLLEDIGRIRDVKFAPDKFLYLMIEDTGKIVRIIPLVNKGKI